MLFLQADEFERYVAHQLVIDCVEMVLSRQNTGERVYSGAGSIRQAADGGLEYVLYDTKHQPSAADFAFLSLPLGTWLNESHLFGLHAIDQHRRTWSARWVDAAPSVSADNEGVVVRGEIREISCRDDREPGGAAFVAFSPVQVSLPTNRLTRTAKTVDGRTSMSTERNVWVPNLRHGKAQFTKRGDGFIFELSGVDTRLPDEFEDRVEEALTFVLGERVRWTAWMGESERETHLTLRSERQRGRGARLGRPIAGEDLDAVAECGSLFDVYLQHLLTTSLPGKHNPISVNVASVLEGSGSPIEQECLALSVHVESLVRRDFRGYMEEDAAFVKQVEDAVEYLEKWQGPPEVCKRMRGAMRATTRPSVLAALKHLAREGAVAERHYLAWEVARNPSAHGLATTKSPRDIAELCNVVYQLFILLVARTIGFDGRLTDYTVPGYPLRRLAEIVKDASSGIATS